MTLMLPDDVIAPTYTMSNDLKGITEPAPPTLYPQAPDAFWANVNPPKFSVSSPTRAAQTALCNYIEQRNKQKIFQTGI